MSRVFRYKLVDNDLGTEQYFDSVQAYAKGVMDANTTYGVDPDKIPEWAGPASGPVGRDYSPFKDAELNMGLAGSQKYRADQAARNQAHSQAASTLGAAGTWPADKAFFDRVMQSAGEQAKDVPDHVSRLREEFEQLLERLDKLSSFMEFSIDFLKLGSFDQSLLVQQHAAMSAYRVVLGLRLRRAEG